MSIEAMTQALEALKAARHGHCDHAWADEAIADLNAAIEQAEKQKPVACRHEWFSTGGMEPGKCRCIHCGKWGNTTPPAQPAQRQPLTSEQINQIIEQCRITMVNYCSDYKQIEFARAVEAAHGIKGEPK